MYVASYVGAWIETLLGNAKRESRRSHPMWVRGLKHKDSAACVARLQSHPMWVRGLKHPPKISSGGGQRVASYVGAWIETQLFKEERFEELVASYVGAWIETREKTSDRYR